MHTVQLNMDDSIFDEFMELLATLPKDKIKVISDKKSLDVSFEESLDNIDSEKFDIERLLKDNGLAHFKYFKEDSRIVYTHNTGTPQQNHDFARLKALLKENNIKYESLGLDVIMIELD